MELTHLADTSVLIDPPLQPVIDEPHLIVTSVICLGELEAGVLLAGTAGIRAARLRRLTAVTASVPAFPVRVLHLSAVAWQRAGRIAESGGGVPGLLRRGPGVVPERRGVSGLPGLAALAARLLLSAVPCEDGVEAA